MKKLLLLLIPSLFLNAQVGLDYYLGDLSEYNKSIPTPLSVIGHEVGEFHISHDKLSHYVQEISRASNRVKLVNRGKSYENRTSWLMIITSESNHSRLEEIRKQHLELSRDIAQKFNNDFNCKEFFPIPDPLIPKNISKTWFKISQKLGRPPILSYASYALNNWKLQDKNKPFDLENIRILQK